MHDFTDPDLVSREYATTGRLEMRRLDRTGWLAGGDDPWLLALAAIARLQTYLDAHRELYGRWLRRTWPVRSRRPVETSC